MVLFLILFFWATFLCSSTLFPSFILTFSVVIFFHPGIFSFFCFFPFILSSSFTWTFHFFLFLSLYLYFTFIIFFFSFTTPFIIYFIHSERERAREDYINHLFLSPTEHLHGPATDHAPSHLEGRTPTPGLQEESAGQDQGLGLHPPGLLQPGFPSTGLRLEVQLLPLLCKLIFVDMLVIVVGI